MTDKKIKILVADEQIKSVEFLKKHLEESGYEVVGVTQGNQIADLCLKEKFDMFLLSLNLADTDSIALCKNLKSCEATSDIPVMLITSHREIEEKINALESGADDFITKPFNMDELKVRIRVAVKGKAFRDVLKEKTQHLEESALRDELTNLYNRRYIRERMFEEISRASRFGEVVSCVIFDLDQFKAINTSYGHGFGDKILIEIAGIIKQNVRNVDIVGRYGGEEFVILLPETPLDGALIVAEKLRCSIEEKVFKEGEASAQVTVSVGVASTQEKDGDDLLYYADMALDKAKTSGKNKVVAWKKED